MPFGIKLKKSDLALRLSLLRQPSLIASFSETGLTSNVFLSSVISTEQGIPTLNGNAVSSLIFVGM